MADQLTPPVEKTPEEIEHEMLMTRESITEKVAALENQVVGTVQSAANSISGTVEAVKSLVAGAPEAVSDTVKQATAAMSETMKSAFDFTGHVRRHPWASVGVSALLGCITAWLLPGGRRESLGAPEGYHPAAAGAAPPPPAPPRAADVPHAPGVFDEFMTMIGRKVKDLAETAINSLSTSVKSNIEEGVPKLIDDAATRLTGNGSVGEVSPPHAQRFGGHI